MNWYRIIGILVCSASFFIILAAYCASYILTRYRTFMVPAEEMPTVPIERFCVDSVRSAQLACWFVRAKEPKGIVIASHGIADSKNGVFQYVSQFLAHNYSLVVYDLRHHNESSGAYCTLGGYEIADLGAITRHVQETYGKDTPIFYWGFSLGATISLCAAGAGADVKAVAAQAPFNSMKQVLRHYLWNFYRLPPTPTTELTCFFMKMRTGIEPKKVNVSAYTDTLKNIPVLVYGSKDDRQVPFHWLKDIADEIGDTARCEFGEYGHYELNTPVREGGDPTRGIRRAAEFFDNYCIPEETN